MSSNSFDQEGLRARTLRSLGAVGFRQTFRRLWTFLITVLLYRFLSARDFGIFSICEAVIAWVIMCQDLGIQDVLIQKKRESNYQNFLQTAWLIRVALTLILFVIFFANAGLVARFLGREEIILPLQVFLITTVIHLMLFSVELDLQKSVRFEKFIVPDLAGQAASSIIALILAFMGRGYWALIVGGIVGPLCRWFLLCSSHRVPKVPGRWDWSLVGELLRPSIWMFGGVILSYLLSQALNVMVGKLFDFTSVGLFYLAFNWANCVVTSVLQYASRVMFPAVSEIEQNLSRVRKAFKEYSAWTSFVAAPFNVGLSVLAPILISVVAGEKWSAAAPLCQILCFYAYFRALTSPCYTLLQSLGKYKTIFFCRVVELGVLMAGIYPVSRIGGLSGVCLLLCISKIIGWWMSYIFIHRNIEENPFRNLPLLVPSLVSAVLMGSILILLVRVMGTFQLPNIVILGLGAIIGTAIYFSSYTKLFPNAGYNVQTLFKELKKHSDKP